jgi:pyrrolidone-carboxylate peptidase
MKTALLTASETFGKYITNPTKWLALTADGKIINGHKIHSLVFPSIIRFPKDAETPGETIVKKAIEINASVIISFGMASGVKGFRIERTATNWIENKAYCPTYESKKTIDPSKPAHEKVQIDLNKWDLNKIKEGFRKNKISYDSNISDDPGKYSCNGWIYRTIYALKKHKCNIPYIFVHTACTKKAIEFIHDFDKDKTIIKEKDLLKALEIFLESSLS